MEEDKQPRRAQTARSARKCEDTFHVHLRRYRPADLEAIEYLHVFAIQPAGAYLGRGPWDDEVYAIEEAYLNNQGEF